MNGMSIDDNGGRRKSSDRRQYQYTVHIPERRKGSDRRTGDDRRQHDRPVNLDDPLQSNQVDTRKKQEF